MRSSRKGAWRLVARAGSGHHDHGRVRLRRRRRLDSATTAGGGEKKTIAFAFVGPLTGPNANLGINIRDGAKVAIEEANAAGDDVQVRARRRSTPRATPPRRRA